MGIRLKGFDYKRPYFYMVTLKRAQGFPDFARVIGDPASHYREPTNAELYRRCHEMGDLIVERLTKA